MASTALKRLIWPIKHVSISWYYLLQLCWRMPTIRILLQLDKSGSLWRAEKLIFLPVIPLSASVALHKPLNNALHSVYQPYEEEYRWQKWFFDDIWWIWVDFKAFGTQKLQIAKTRKIVHISTQNDFGCLQYVLGAVYKLFKPTNESQSLFFPVWGSVEKLWKIAVWRLLWEPVLTGTLKGNEKNVKNVASRRTLPDVWYMSKLRVWNVFSGFRAGPNIFWVLFGMIPGCAVFQWFCLTRGTDFKSGEKFPRNAPMTAAIGFNVFCEMPRSCLSPQTCLNDFFSRFGAKLKNGEKLLSRSLCERLPHSGILKGNVKNVVMSASPQTLPDVRYMSTLRV